MFNTLMYALLYLLKCQHKRNAFGWLVVLRIYVASAVFQPYRHLEAGDNQSLKCKWRGAQVYLLQNRIG